MKIVIAQGNPGTQFVNTRHNIGWLLVDILATNLGAAFTPQSKFHADVATAIIADEKVLLVKPTTYYNDTGRAARALIDFYKLNPISDLLVIHDDLSLPFGTIRIREKGSDAGNNGIKSITSHLGQDYWRARIGIWDERRELQPDADFVLSRLSSSALQQVEKDIAPKITGIIEQFCQNSLTATSHQIITK